MAPMRYLGAREKLIHEKSLESKISFQTPFNYYAKKFKNDYVLKCDRKVVADRVKVLTALKLKKYV
jgi:hypothetical protein